MRYLRISKEIRRSAQIERAISLYIIMYDIIMYDISDYNRRYRHNIKTLKNKTEISRKKIINYIFFCVDKAKFCHREQVQLT